ncbi:unnamed protein product, partial [Citrullus colocynthis]
MTKKPPRGLTLRHYATSAHNAQVHEHHKPQCCGAALQHHNVIEHQTQRYVCMHGTCMERA